MIRTLVPSDGFEGILFPGDGSSDKVVIVISGSNGGMKLTCSCAEFYHRNGIPVLALALFATKGTQPDLDRIPLEYVENAIRWLRSCGYRKIGIDGTSKGSELALVAASKFPEISCVIARVPSYFVSEGLAGKGKKKGPSGTSCWSYRGAELPYAPYKMRKFNMIRMLLRERELHLIDFNGEKEVSPESLIPIEQIQGPVLLLSSRQDSVWPSYESAVQMEKRLSECGFSYEHRHVAFEHVSHALVTEESPLYRIAFRSERRNAAGCRADREQLKAELLHWVREVWQ